MKKTLSIFICLGIMVCMLVSCTSNTNTICLENDDDDIAVYETPPEEDTYSSLIIRTEFDEYPVDVEEIVLIIKNPAEYMNSYGEPFRLEKFVEDEWEIIPLRYGGGLFLYWLAFIESNTEHTLPIDMAHRFDLPLSPGTYRIVKGFFWWPHTDIVSEKSVSNEFVLI